MFRSDILFVKPVVSYMKHAPLLSNIGKSMKLLQTRNSPPSSKTLRRENFERYVIIAFVIFICRIPRIFSHSTMIPLHLWYFLSRYSLRRVIFFSTMGAFLKLGKILPSSILMPKVAVVTMILWMYAKLAPELWGAV